MKEAVVTDETPRPHSGESVKSTKRLTREERLDETLQAAADLITERGLDGVSLSAIATRTGVSRQNLYLFFPTVDSIFVELFTRMRAQLIRGETVAALGTPSYSTLIKAQFQQILEMPVAFAMMGSKALNNGQGNDGLGSSLREVVMGTIEHDLIVPLEAAGFKREALYASFLAMMNASLSLNIAIHDGLTTLEIARQRLDVIIDAITDNPYRGQDQ